jgi:tetratricopeptide (TPR) repeat protein
VKLKIILNQKKIDLSMKKKISFSAIPLFIFAMLMHVPAPGSNISEAQRLYFEGKYNLALPYLLKALEKQPDSSMLNYFLGMTYFKLKKYTESKKVFEKVVAIKPDYELARLQLARACYEVGDYAWANVHLMHLQDIRTKEFKKSDFAMIQAVTEWRDNFAKKMDSSKAGNAQLVQKKDLSPPEITIIDPKTTRGIKLVSERTGIFIKGSVRDESPLMWVKINDENISFDENGKFSKNLFLHIGRSAVKVVACDIYLNCAEKSFEVNKKIGTKKFATADVHKIAPELGNGTAQRYAIVIGIGKYKDGKIPPLKYTVADARGVYNVLSNEKYGFIKKKNVKILIDEEASTQNIKKTFGTWLKSHVRENDFVTIYFAGHGANEAGSTYWVTYDSDIDDLYGTAISNDSISEMLNGIESKTLIVFLDSCYSAATINRGWQTRSLIEKDPFQEFKGEGRVVITSSNGKQLSLEIQEYGHGVFTYYLIQGLTGKADQNVDGYITLDEIWDYVKNNVRNTAKKYGIHQTPIIDGRHSSGILLSKYPKQ